MRARLSLLLFLQYAVPGAWTPILSAWLQARGFEAPAIGWISACGALAALISPLMAGQLADRCWPSQYCIAGGGLLAAGLLWLLPQLNTPLAVFACCLAFWMVMTPVLTWGIALAFAHLPQAERHYGRVRLWGTVGWVAPNLLLGGWLAGGDCSSPAADLAACPRLGGLLALVLAAYALTLPHTPPCRGRQPGWAPLQALALLRHRSFAVYALTAIGTCLTLSFGQQLAPLLLQQLGLPAPWLCPALCLMQSLEITGLALLPGLLRRAGLRRTLLLGLSGWTIALFFLALGQPIALVLPALSLYGLYISCFLVAGQVFANQRAPADLRTSAQGLLTFLNGIGLFLGHVLAGWLRQQLGGNLHVTFLSAAGLAVLLMAFFIYQFRERPALAAPPAVAT
jgi:MFS family permease